MAAKYGLSGEVDNRTDGVSVIVQGDIQTINQFGNDILHYAPPASVIKSIEIKSTETPDKKNMVILNTSIGGKRILDMLSGNQLPRIC